jgi:pimeloyl-ACP methyl ester carboxylesterase
MGKGDDWLLSGELSSTERFIGTRFRSYSESSSSIRNGDVTLAGTLKVPIGSGKCPAILLLAGSNAQSREGQNCFVGFNADFFARLGFIALSYDKRGVGQSTGPREDNNLDGDALAAIRWLRQRPDVDTSQIGIWGISQGGILEPKVAELDGQVSFLINVSGSVVHGHEQEIERTELQMRADGYREAEIREAVKLQTLKFNYAKTGEGWDEYLAQVTKCKDAQWLEEYVGPPTSKDDPGFKVWREGAGSFSPADSWKKFQGPALLIFGTHETYCNPKINIERFRMAMTDAHNTKSRVVSVQSANHEMRESKTGGEREKPYLSRFAGGYFPALFSWIQAWVKMPNSRAINQVASSSLVRETGVRFRRSVSSN